jgi:aryl-alcohol dehydrogenase-like predicted oxidoreductase
MSGFMNRFLNNEILMAVEKLKPIAADENLSMAQLALAWVLREERVSSAIIGATKPEQIVDNAAASDVQLSSETLTAIDKILAEIQQS